MFKKIALTLVTLTILICGLSSLSTFATDAELVQNNSKPSSLLAGDNPVTFSSDQNLTNEPTDQEQDSEDNGYKPTSICGGPCLVTGTSDNNDLGYLQTTSSVNQKSSTLTFAISVFRFVIYIITAISILVIIGGLIATIIMSILRKKFAVTPFIVFAIGILFLVVSIICTTIISLTSFL
jgi:hypothetical protein